MSAFLRLVALFVATFLAALLRMPLVVLVFLVMAVFSMVSLVVFIVVAFLMMALFACRNVQTNHIRLDLVIKPK